MADNLKPCPFCGGEAIMHMGEFPTKYTCCKKGIPKGARFIRSIKYPDGHISYEYKTKAFIPKCLDTKCMGRTTRQFESGAC